MLRIEGRAAIGEVRSKLRMVEEEVQRVCEIPLDITIEGAAAAAEIMGALHVGELFDALYTESGAVRMMYFGEQQVGFPLSNIKAVIGFGAGRETVTIAAADLTKVRWTVTERFGLHITCKVNAKLSPEQWVGLFCLQPYTGLTVSLTDNQSALSLQAA